MSAGDVQGLLACPFCGNDDIQDWGESTWSRPVKWMYCTECQAQGPRIMLGRDESEDGWHQRIREEWNRRSALDGDALAKLIREAEARAEKAEQERQFTLSDGQRLLRKCDVDGVCDTPDLCFEASDTTVRCGPCAAKVSSRAGIPLNPYTHSNPEAMRLRRERDAALSRLAAAEAQVQLANYVLQDRLHNRLTPRVVDIAYSAFMSAKRPNNEDGGPSDWVTDTYPMVMAKIGEICSALATVTPHADTPEGRTDALRDFVADFAAAKIDALRYSPPYGASPEDEPDPVVDAETVWAWQADAKDALAEHDAAILRDDKARGSDV